MHHINVIFRQNPRKIVGGGVKKMAKFLVLGLLISVLYMLPSFADITTVTTSNASGYASTIKSYFGDNTDVDRFNKNSGSIPLSGSALDETDVHSSKGTAYGTAYGRVFIIATEVKLNGSDIVGVKICPIQVDAWIKKNPNADSEGGTICGNGEERTVRFYQQIPNGENGDNTKCLWLCANGYTGETCEYEINTSYKNKYSTQSVSYSLSIKKNIGDKDTATNKGVNLGATYKCSGSGYKYNDLVKKYLVATEMVSSNTGAKVQPVMLSTYVEHVGIVENAHAHLFYNTVGDAKLFCLAGYQPNSDNTACVKIAENPCAGSSSATISFSGYQYSGGVICEYNKSNNSWCRKPNGGITKCDVGYYGSNISALSVSAACVWSANGCTKCPNDPVTGKSGTTSGVGATSIDKCYRASRTGTQICDSVGCYEESGLCYYK